MRWALVALLFLPAQDGQDEEIRRWIRELGADDIDVRDRATDALKGAGEKALAPLREAAKSDDPEVRARAEVAMAHIEWGRYVLPNLAGQVDALLTGLMSADADERLQSLEAVLTVLSPPELLARFTKDPDERVRRRACFACLQCPSRRVGEPLLDYVESLGADRGRLNDVLVDPGFFSHFDKRHLARVEALEKSGVQETRVVATLVRAVIDGRAGEGLRALLKGDDDWAVQMAVATAGIVEDDAISEDVAALIDRPGVNFYAVNAALQKIGGPKSLKALVDRFRKDVEAGHMADASMPITLAHVEAPGAGEALLAALEKGIDNSSVVHALADLEYQPAVPVLLKRYREGSIGEFMENYISNLSNPEFAREGFMALRRTHGIPDSGEGHAGDGSFIKALAETNALDRAEPAIECLDARFPEELREAALGYVAETILPPAVEAKLEGALGAILAKADDPLRVDAARAAGFHGFKWRADWKPFEEEVRASPSYDAVIALAEMGAPGAAEIARAGLKTSEMALRVGAFKALVLVGGAPDVPAALDDLHSSAALEVVFKHGTADQIGAAIDKVFPEVVDLSSLPFEGLALLAKTTHPKFDEALVRLTRAPPPLSDEAVELLARRNPARAKETLRPLPNDPAARWTRVRALAALGDEGVAPELMAALASQDPTRLAEAMDGLARLKWKAALPPLRQYARYGQPAETAGAARAIVAIDGEASLPLLRELAEDRTNEAPLLLAMLQAGDKAAIGRYLRFARAKDNHYDTALAPLNDLDAAVNAAAYAAHDAPADFGTASVQYGVLLRRVENAFGVPIRLSPGLDALKQYYDSVSCPGRSTLLSALEMRPNKWDANVVHVHRGDHILLCQPLEAYDYWKKRAEADR